MSETDAEQRKPPIQCQPHQVQHLGIIPRQSRPWGEDQPIVALELLLRERLLLPQLVADVRQLPKELDDVVDEGVPIVNDE